MVWRIFESIVIPFVLKLKSVPVIEILNNLGDNLIYIINSNLYSLQFISTVFVLLSIILSY